MNRYEKLDFIAKTLGISKTAVCHILGLSACWGHFPDAQTANDDRLTKIIEYISDAEYGYTDAKRIVDSIPEHKRPMVMSVMLGELNNKEVNYEVRNQEAKPE